MSEGAIIINVDDNEPARYAKGRVLTRAGFVVHNAATGREALQLVEDHAPDLVLLDVNLPDVSGIEVCQILKSSPHAASVIVLQISATATGAFQATKALNMGADSYLTEPVDPDVLVATVRALLRLRAAERELTLANERLAVANRELRKSNEDLAQFAFVASHDLQEPLRTITIFAGILERSLGPRLIGDEQEYLQHMVRGADRMRALIVDLLHYSQVGEVVSPAQSVDLNAAFQWAIENLRQLIGETGAQISADTLPVVSGDEAQLGHVFQNLIGNALKYRGDSTPEVRASASRKDGSWVIEVRDNGMGIDRKYWDLIFVPFKRLHSQDIPGTGIGLAVCRRIIEAHGGKIWVESAKGQGSTFYLSLPAGEDKPKKW